MIVGFTGTQKNMTDSQKDMLLIALYELNKMDSITEVHHGDCIGADKLFHDICFMMDYPIVIHPPTNEGRRAFCKDATVLPAKDYLVRNRDIVDASDAVIAVPPTVEELRRSGTWSTYRYAVKQGKEVYLITPDVETKIEEDDGR